MPGKRQVLAFGDEPFGGFCRLNARGLEGLEKYLYHFRLSWWKI